MPTPNERILDHEIEHALRVQGAANRIARQVVAALGRLDDETENLLAGRIARALRQPRPLEAVAAILAVFAFINQRAVRAAFRVIERAVAAFAVVEAGYYALLIGAAIGRELATPTADALAQAIRRMKVFGESLAQQEARFAAYRLKRVEDLVYRVLSAPLTVDQALAELRSPRGPLADGRNAADALARTNTTAGGRVARGQVERTNQELLVGQFWSAVLDNRTTPVCRANDGSTRVLSADELQSWEETGFAKPKDLNVAEKRERGLDPEKPATIDEHPWSNGYEGPYPAHYGERTIIVPYRRRGKEKPPDKLTFEEWLESRPEHEQRKLLGPSRYALWKSGKFELRDFVNDRGRTLTLAELRRQDAAAFDAAMGENG